MTSMATKVIMPQMGESIFEGTLTKWLKKIGDAVVRDEPLFEISTDKVDSEIPAPASGVLSQILVPEGKTIQIGAILAIINGTDGAEKDAVPIPAQVVALQEIAAETTSEILESPVVTPSYETPPMALPATAELATHAASAQGIQPLDIRTSPLVRRLARENNLDLSQIRGTGLEGRITKEDVLNYLAQRPSNRESVPARPQFAAPVDGVQEEAPASVPPPAAIPVFVASPAQSDFPRFSGESKVVPMTPMRKAIAEHMVLSKKTSAHVNTVFEVDMSPVVQLRESHKVEFQDREGVPLTYTPFFAKALVDNILEFPVFNSSVSGDNIVYKKPVNLGIAVALDTGLIVPVVKDAQLKSLTGLALAIYDLAERARTKKLKPEDVQYGTITMTNPGSFGSLFNTPIISQPQVAILGIGGIEKRPVVIHDAIAIRSMVCLSLTFDHRVIDGSVADRFMAGLKERLQSWTQWSD
jgi:pyruvate dehydrogenase E2 component (dihydrolipoamide acetyltransferase)